MFGSIIWSYILNKKKIHKKKMVNMCTFKIVVGFLVLLIFVHFSGTSSQKKKSEIIEENIAFEKHSKLTIKTLTSDYYNRGKGLIIHRLKRSSKSYGQLMILAALSVTSKDNRQKYMNIYNFVKTKVGETIGLIATTTTNHFERSQILYYQDHLDLNI